MYTLPFSTAEQYFASRFGTATWSASTEQEKQKALNTACLVIDAMFTFPKGTFIDNGDGTISCDVRIQAAICEQANWLLNCDPTQYPSLLTLGLASASASGVSMTVDPNMVAPLMCQTARRLIGELGVYYDASESIAKVTCFPLNNEW